MTTDDTQTTYEVGRFHKIDDNTLASKNIKIISKSGNNVQLQYDNKTYHAVIKNFDPQNKIARINVSGFDFDIKIKEPLDKLINELGFLKVTKISIKELKAPMPGMVVNLFVNEDDVVAEGDKLLTLEAMKMENILKSPCQGKIKKIHINKSQSVDKNQILIEFE